MIEQVLQHPGHWDALLAPADGVRLSYAALADRIESAAARLRREIGNRGLVFLVPGADVEAVVLYLGCLRAGLPLCLVEPQPEALARLARAYQPALLLVPDTVSYPEAWHPAPPIASGYTAALRTEDAHQDLHPDLTLLLTTSGSTGSPKLVRLAGRNLDSNASAIAEYLALAPGERAVQSLPLHYSYGLSVLNSHLVAGATVIMTPHSFMRPEFWRDVDAQRATSFAGVPYMYETLHRLRYDPARHPSVRTYTQAGGALRRDLIRHYHERATAVGARLVVMYGQTEATARIAYVPPERLGQKIGAIGVPVPGGRLRLEALEPTEGLAAQLVYEGPNVMMGYAESSEDLALGDVQQGVLHTGDLATVDDEGYFTLVGRLKRFAKLFGRRVSLEDVERELESTFPLRAIASEAGDRLRVHVAGSGQVDDDRLVSHLARFLAVPPSSIVVSRLEELPMTPAGKKDYKAVEAVG